MPRHVAFALPRSIGPLLGTRPGPSIPFESTAFLPPGDLRNRSRRLVFPTLKRANTLAFQVDLSPGIQIRTTVTQLVPFGSAFPSLRFLTASGNRYDLSQVTPSVPVPIAE